MKMEKGTGKKLLSLLLTAAMVFTLLPPITAQAAVSNLTVSQDVVTDSSKLLGEAYTIAQGTSIKDDSGTYLVNWVGESQSYNITYSSAALKFDISGISGSVSSASLQIFVLDSHGSAEVNLIPTTDNNWNETDPNPLFPTYNPANSLFGSIPVTANSWKSFDVKDYIQSRIDDSETEVSFVLTGLTGTGSDQDFSFVCNQDPDTSLHAKLVVDATPAPLAPVVAGAALTNDSTPTWSWTSGGGGSGTYRYILDDTSSGTPWTQTAVASFTPASSLSEGAHTLYVEESNGAGGWSPSGDYTIMIDTTPPAAPVITGFSDDTGSSPSDVTTNDTTPTFTGTAEANSTVTVYQDGSSVGTTTANGSGSWSFAVTTPLNEGPHSFAATATDAAGNVSLYSPGYSIIIDTIAPTITFGGLLFSADTGSSSTDFITRTAAQTICATLSAGLGAGETVYGSLDNGATWTDVTTYVSGTTLTWYGVTLTGSSTLKLRAVDLAGNGGAVSSQAYTLDTLAPSVTGVTDGGNYGTSVSAAFSGGTATLKKDSDAPAAYLSGTVIGANGSYQLVVTDAAGNSTTVNFTVALATPPTITTTSLPNATVGVEYNATLTVTGDAPITWTLDSLDQPPPGIDLMSDGDLSGTPAAAGTYSFTVRATNAGGSDTYITTIQVNKGSQTAPAAPTLSSKNETSVTLVSWATMEYSKDGTTWQSSSVFTGLSPNTEYTFYMRLAETTNYNPSPASPPLTVTTYKAALSGMVGFSGTLKFGETLTVNTSGLTTAPVVVPPGTLSYQWKRNGGIIGGATGSSYTLTADDIGAIITVTVSASNCDGGVTASLIGIVAKADGPAAPTVTGGYTGDGSTFTYTVNPIPGAEYSKDGASWQDDNVFTSFTTVSAETFYARIKETATHKKSAAGSTGTIIFTKLNDRPAPALSYTVSAGDFPKTITITEVAGAYYSFNGGSYGSTRIYTSNSAEDVTLSIRLMATDTHFASPVSTATVNTANQAQTAPDAFTLTYAGVNDTNYTVTIPVTAGAQYSFDGSTWSGTNTKTGCTPGETVTGYKRMAAKPGYNASPSVSADVTLPLFQVKTPTASPNGGNFTGSQNVTFSCETAGAAIHYTTDGSIPTAGSALYTAPVNLTATATIKAIALKSGMTDSEVISVIFTEQSGGDSGKGGGSSGGGTPAPKYEASVTSGDGAIVTEVKVNANSASTELSATQAASGKNIVVTMPKIAGVTNYTLDIPVSNLSERSGDGSITLNASAGNITLPSDMLTGMSAVSGSKAQVHIGTVQASDLPKEAQNKVGNHPVVSLSLSIDGRTTAWNNPNAPVTISIPYTPTGEELKNPAGITVWYIDGSGNLTEMRDAKYDPATKSVVFTTTHFSYYAVGYKAPAVSAGFADVVPGVWYYDAVTFIAEKGITTGTGEGKFSPDVTLTRGQFIVMLMRAYGIEADKNPTDNFYDAGNTWYTGYLAAAKRLGISAGVGKNMYAPGKEITRQEMFTLLYNALNVIGQLPQGSSSKTLSDFTDAEQINSWAKDAVTLLVETGNIGGNAGKLTPLSTTTRAEMAQVLYNLLGK